MNIVSTALAANVKLAVPEPTGDINWTLVLLAALIVIALCWFFLIHRRGKDKEAAAAVTLAGHAALNDLTAIVHKAHEIIENQQAIIHAHVVAAQAAAPAAPVPPASIPAEPHNREVSELAEQAARLQAKKD